MYEGEISGIRFHPDMLHSSARPAGLSGFMRTRNGVDFIKPAVLSHLPYFDEIVIGYNQCTDGTDVALLDLVRAYPEKIRVFHYTDRVVPLGSDAHRRLPGNSPQSFVNFSNMVLAKTRFRTVTKIDDDHLAIPDALGPVTTKLRATGAGRKMHCFSGLNVTLAEDRQPGINDQVPVSGMGDVGFFDVTPRTFFRHDRRFEAFEPGLHRIFVGFLYWHLKYLKSGSGFANYELQSNPASRYRRQFDRFNRSKTMLLDDVPHHLDSLLGARRFAAPFHDRTALRVAQIHALRQGNLRETPAAALDRLRTLAIAPLP